MPKFIYSKQQNIKSILKTKNLEKNYLEKQKSIFRKSVDFFKKTFSLKVIDENLKEQLEDIFLSLDFGPYLSQKLSENIAKKWDKSVDLKKLIKNELIEEYKQKSTEINIKKDRTNVVCFVGPNGYGKTTTIAKFANLYKSLGFKILLVAADTFRAGAVDQLKSWSEKLEVDIFVNDMNKEDPSSLIYKALDANKHGEYDLVIIDTSGRQHNNESLMRELQKIHRTIKKFGEDIPNETFLVIDSNAGQTGILQAKTFLSSVPVTGLIVTKLDSMRRGGIIFAINSALLNIPIKSITIGESAEDIREFHIETLVDSWIENMQF